MGIYDFKDTRRNYPVGSTVKFVESGQEAEVISLMDTDEYNEYGAETKVIVRMGGLVIRTDASKIERI